MIQERKIVWIEYAAIILLWTLVIISPLLFMDEVDQNWVAVHIMWIECAIVGFAYLINRFLLMPHLFFAKRYTGYITALVVLFIALGIFVLYMDGVNIILSLFGESRGSAPMPPMMGDGGGGAPHHAIPRHAMPHMKDIFPPMVKVLTLSAIVIALDMGLSISVKWVISEQKQAAINRERIMAQLFNLQSQVSPHFFMNTLNNIHALVDLDSQRAKQTIIELSGLMDYLLYDTASKELVSLQREIEFIGNYISLMRLRYSQQVKIEFSHNDNIPPIKIPPLLFLNFIENAFKYGVDYDKESLIKIRFNFSDTSIEMSALNSNHSSSVKSNRHGMGISNSRKRLDLIYGDRYTLNISDKEKIYYVNLKIPTQ